MLQTVGDLRAKGLTLYADRQLNVEIENQSVYNLVDSRHFEAYISVDKVFDGDRKTGKMFIFEEYYQYLQVDLVQEVDGVFFRNYDNIESLDIEFEFDTEEFLISVFRELRWMSAYRVLILLLEGEAFFSACNIMSSVEKRLDAETRSRFILDGEDIEVYKPLTPTGYWAEDVPVDYYTFFRDWFEDPLERDREGIWRQYWVSNTYINKAFMKQVLKHGVFSPYKGCNYYFNIYPSHKSVLDGRAVRGDFSMDTQEYRLVKDDILSRFEEWYGTMSTSLFGGTSSLLFAADRLTVDGFTGIAKVETRRIYERDKHVLESLLGPLTCVRVSDSGECLLWEYGSVFNSEMRDDPEITEQILDGTITSLNKDDIAYVYKIVYANIETVDEEIVQSEQTKNAYYEHNPSPIECLYAAENFNGKIGGQVVYKKGLGTEHEYFESFGDFLDKRNLSVEDLLNYFDDNKDDIMVRIKEAMISKRFVDVRAFCEFYDRETRSPFDGIYVYVPTVARMVDSKIEVRKKKVTYAQDGSFTEEEVPVVYLGTGDYKLPFDKDEYVDSIVVECPNVLMSKYTRIKIEATFKEEMSNIDDTYIRVGASDLTYMNLREFAL